MNSKATEATEALEATEAISMPNTKSAAKRLRQSIKATTKNVNVRRQVKYLVKETRRAMTASKEEALKLYHSAQKAIDKAAQRGIISKNTAARKKSRLMKAIGKK